MLQESVYKNSQQFSTIQNDFDVAVKTDFVSARNSQGRHNQTISFRLDRDGLQVESMNVPTFGSVHGSNNVNSNPNLNGTAQYSP